MSSAPANSSSAFQLAPSWRRAVVGGTLATLALLLVFTVSTELAPRAEPSDLLDTWVYTLAMTGSAGIALARSLLVREERLAWALVGAGLATYAAGDWIYVLVVQNLEPEPYPSIAEPFYLAFYALTTVGVVALMRRELPGATASVWLDGVVAGLGVAALTSALTFDPILRTAGEGALTEVVVNLSYPLFDLVVLGLAIGAMAVQRWKVTRRWLALVAGLAVFSLGDTVYVFESATGGYQAGGALDITWPVGALAIALAAWTRPPRRLLVREDGPAVLLAPVLIALAATGLLVAQHFRPLSFVALVLAAATVTAALARIALTVHEVEALALTREQANTDVLTGLANRRRLFKALERGLERAQPTSSALILVDLDRFKEINDALGHPAGDAILQGVAQRLAGVLRPDDVLARLGGDEFAAVLADADARGAHAVARRLFDSLAEPILHAGVSLHVDASVGVALASEDVREAEEMLRRADVALYRAKRGRLRVATYDVEDDRVGRVRLGTVEEARSALDGGDMTCVFAPQLALGDGRVRAVGALARWDHPVRGRIAPGAFLPLLEQAGMTPALTRRVLDLALEARRAWTGAAGAPRVAVNLSMADLFDGELARLIAAALERHGLAGTALELEVTEQMIMADPDRRGALLSAIREQGVTVALDDFGTDHSSMARLQAVPLDVLKLAPSLVARSTGGDRSAALVRSTADLAHALGLVVVAKGVEDAATLDALEALGCDAVQGFHLARPMEQQAIAPFLAAHELVGDRGERPGRAGPPGASRVTRA